MESIKIKNIFWFVLFVIFVPVSQIRAQEVDFGKYYDSSVTLTELAPQGLDFGTLIAGSGTEQVSLSNAVTISIKGIKFMDVLVNITASQNIVLPSCPTNPSCQIPFTLQAAYANLGNNNIAQAQFISITNNAAMVLFPILRRQSGPPGPPPIPPHKEFNPALYQETAYIYLYGSINVGGVTAGDYSGQITVMVYYQ